MVPQLKRVIHSLSSSRINLGSMKMKPVLLTHNMSKAKRFRGLQFSTSTKAANANSSFNAGVGPWDEQQDRCLHHATPLRSDSTPRKGGGGSQADWISLKDLQFVLRQGSAFVDWQNQSQLGFCISIPVITVDNCSDLYEMMRANLKGISSCGEGGYVIQGLPRVPRVSTWFPMCDIHTPCSKGKMLVVSTWTTTFSCISQV